MSQQQSSIPSIGFLRLPQILAIIPISKSAWWEGCRTGRFPRPVKLGPRTTVWKAQEIREFIDQAGIQCEADSHDLR